MIVYTLLGIDLRPSEISAVSAMARKAYFFENGEGMVRWYSPKHGTGGCRRTYTVHIIVYMFYSIAEILTTKISSTDSAAKPGTSTTTHVNTYQVHNQNISSSLRVHLWSDVDHVDAHRSVPQSTTTTGSLGICCRARPRGRIGAHVQLYRRKDVAEAAEFDGGHDLRDESFVILP